MRFVQKGSEFGEPVDVEPNLGLLFLAEGDAPVPNLRLEFDLTP